MKNEHFGQSLLEDSESQGFGHRHASSGECAEKRFFELFASTRSEAHWH
jgi:hypothetical protein